MATSPRLAAGAGTSDQGGAAMSNDVKLIGLAGRN